MTPQAENNLNYAYGYATKINIYEYIKLFIDICYQWLLNYLYLFLFFVIKRSIDIYEQSIYFWKVGLPYDYVSGGQY